jgi:DNA-binding XRE family transcriptional regulator
MSLKSGCDLSDSLDTRLMQRTSSQAEVLRRFGEHLRQLRTARQLTQEELAAKAGFSRSYYNELETGKRNISLLNLHKIALCLDLPLTGLLDLDERQ